MAISKTRKVKIMDAKYISPLQMYGPIVQPMILSEGIVYDLVRKLYNVIEIDANKSELKLTLLNFNDPNRFGICDKTQTPVTHKDNSKPVNAQSTAYKIPEKVIPHTSTNITDNSQNIKLPENVTLRAVEKDTVIVPSSIDNIPTPVSENPTSTEPIINEQVTANPAIPLPTADEKEALTADEASNSDVNDSVIYDDEGIDDDEPEEDSDEASGNSSDTSSTSTSPSNKKKHNRGKKHR